MRAVFLGLFLFWAVTSSASPLHCKAKSSQNSSTPTSGELVFDLDRGQIVTIDFRYTIKNNDGALSEIVDRIYSRSPRIRGAFNVEYCNPDDNYTDLPGMYSVFSVCSSVLLPNEKVVFEASLNTKSGGKLSFLKADSTDQFLDFESCREN